VYDRKGLWGAEMKQNILKTNFILKIKHLRTFVGNKI
jgi:hypothetical protein